MTSRCSAPSRIPNYNRILLSPVLAGEQTIPEIVLNPLAWYADNGITLHRGQDGDADRPHPPRRAHRRRHRGAAMTAC